MKLLRYLWASPASFVGIVLGLLAIACGARGRDSYRDNCFEAEAFAKERR